MMRRDAIHLPMLIVWGVTLTSAWGLWAYTSIASTLALVADREPARAVVDSRPIRLEPSGARIDVYGNELYDALAQYEIDVDGDVYERHSPETALSRGGRPEM